MSEQITIALAKGRILEEVEPLLQRMKLSAKDGFTTRKLILPTTKNNIRFMIVRASDVPTYVASAAADFGIVGKDTIIESRHPSITELLDLELAKCRLVVAKSKNSNYDANPLRVATKYVNTAKEYFSKMGRHIELFKLYGSVEISPLVGLSDVIVDLVDTGKTLKANNLQEVDIICDISTRLIANRDSYNIKIDAMQTILADFRLAIDQKC